HAEQHALADAAAGEKADALPAADRQERVDRAHAYVERLPDRRTLERIDRLGDEPGAVLAVERSAAVERLAGAVDHAAEQTVADARLEDARSRHDARAWLHAMQRADRHQQQRVVREPDDLGLRGPSVVADDEATRADRSLTADGLERHADHPRQDAVRNEAVAGADPAANARKPLAPAPPALGDDAFDTAQSAHAAGFPATRPSTQVSAASVGSAGDESAAPGSSAASSSARTRVSTRPSTSERSAVTTRSPRASRASGSIAKR